MKSLSQVQVKYLCGVCLTVFTILLFLYSVQIRHPWFGKLALDSNACWQTGSTIKFADYWYEDGPLNLRFTMLENPRSVETPTPASRTIYPSYPPGTIIPIYLLSLAMGHEADAPLVMGVALANHLLIALCLCFTVFFFLSGLRIHPINAAVFAAIPPVILLLLPGPLLNFQMNYFSDQAVVLPFALFLLLEVLLPNAKTPRVRIMLDLLQSLVIFSGVLTDWFFVPLLLVAFVKRYVTGEFGPGKKIWVVCAKGCAFFFPALLAGALFLWQVITTNSAALLTQSFLFRTAISASGPYQHETRQFHSLFWWKYFAIYYGPAAFLTLLLSLAVLLSVWIIVRRNNTRKPWHPVLLPLVSFALLAVLPCVLHTYMFRQHAVRHMMAALKYTVPLGMLPLVMLPLILYYLPKRGTMQLAGDSPPARPHPPLLFLALGMLCCASLYIACVMPGFTQIFPPPTPDLLAYAENIRHQYRYNDVLYSYHREIPENPPQLLAISHKRVYLITSLDDMRAISAGISSPHHDVILDKP